MLRFLSRSALLNVVVILLCMNVSGQVFLCLSFFYAGGLAAIFRRAIAGTTIRVAIEYLGWLALAMASVSLVILRSEMPISDWMFFVTYTPLLLFCISGEITLPARVQAGIEAAGNMTYSSYLLHFPIQLLIALGFTISGSPIPFYDGWFFAAFVTLAALASYFTYRYFELPAQIFLRRYLIRQARTPTPNATGLLGGGFRSEHGVH
jgi:peptidoglycan/LPS O-acetylase OafA/YrhL